MTNEKAKKMLKARLECLKRETSGTDIDCNYRNCDECNLCYEQGNMGEQKEALDLAIKALEQIRWIPCSERLPEVGSEVLVCFDFKGNRSVYISDFYGDGEFHGLDDEYLTPEGRKCRKAVAWMPLPQAYKAESEDSNADSN